MYTLPECLFYLAPGNLTIWVPILERISVVMNKKQVSSTQIRWDLWGCMVVSADRSYRNTNNFIPEYTNDPE